MQINEIKQKYIELFKQLNYNQDFMAVVLAFIETYDGTNLNEFKEFMMVLLLTLMRLQTLEVKAKGYDALNDQHDEFSSAFAKIKDDFERLNKGLMPSTPTEDSGITE